MNLECFTYDGTFEGFLSVVFESYARKQFPLDVCTEEQSRNKLFAQKEFIPTSPEKADRVWKGLQKKLHQRNQELPLLAYLSQAPGIEMMLLRFCRRVFDSAFSIETDFGDPDILELKKLEKKVMRECMKMLQFLRFQETKDGIYFAAIEPLYDVLPFAIKHFTHRFADQRWIIYDLKRDYGIYYDLHTTHDIVLKEKAFSAINGRIDEDALQEGESLYQTLWKDYFENISIESRKNPRLQRQHMPQRFWKFLPEKS